MANLSLNLSNDFECENCGKPGKTKMFNGFELCAKCGKEAGYDWKKAKDINWS